MSDTDDWLTQEVAKLVKGGFVEEIPGSEYVTMAIAPPKKDEFGRTTQRRFCINYKLFNKITKKDGYPMPVLEEALRMKKARFLPSWI